LPAAPRSFSWQVEQRLRRLVGEHQRVHQHRLGHLLHAALDHHDRLARGGDDHVDLALLALCGVGEGDELAADPADPARRRTAPPTGRR
jgi:hypothetical protein